jgi:hypothetical protein
MEHALVPTKQICDNICSLSITTDDRTRMIDLSEDEANQLKSGYCDLPRFEGHANKILQASVECLRLLSMHC